jgi:hypothetical protein
MVNFCAKERGGSAKSPAQPHERLSEVARKDHFVF